MNNLEEILVPFVIFGAIVMIIKIVTDYRTRKELIAKGEVNENIKFLYEKYSVKSNVLNNVKWGLVLLGIGLAMVSKQIFNDFITDESVLGLMFVFSGIGFLVYYGIASMASNKDSDNSPL